MKIGAAALEPLKEKLRSFLRKNTDVFAWSHKDMPEIDTRVATHYLNIDPEARLVKQKRRNFAPERNDAVAEEAEKLVKAKFIREVQYPVWLSNVVMVKNSNSKWRMCVDFIDLVKWSIELSQFDIQYLPRLVIKGQAAADFIAEFTNSATTPPEDDPAESNWILNIDSSSTDDSSGAGVVLVILDGHKIKYALRFRFPATKNVAEYEALIAKLRMPGEWGPSKS